MKPAGYWTVPRMWEGETCFIVASGPSLTTEQVDAARAAGWRSIVINNGYRIAPWADVHYFCDLVWWDWHRTDPLYQSFGGLRVTLENLGIAKHEPHVRFLRNGGVIGLATEPDELRTGQNSGYQCINLAVHLGVRRIVLLGYDMQPVDGRVHWHPEHPSPTSADIFARCFLPRFPELAAALERLGVEVINCTPGSALRVFPLRSLSEVINAHGLRADPATAPLPA